MAEGRKRYAGLTAECMGGAVMVAGEDLAMDVATEGQVDLKKRNLSRIYSRGLFVAFSGVASVLSGGRDRAAKFSEGMFYASLPIAELAAYHYIRS